MPFVHDGTERYGNATAYWLRNDETGERIPVQDPLLAEQVAGPLPPPGERFNWKPAPIAPPQVGAGTSPTSGLKWTTPEGERDPKRDTPMGKLRDATAPDRRLADTRISLDPLAGMKGDAPSLPAQPRAALPENVTGALDAARPKAMTASEQDRHDKRTGKLRPWQGAQPDDDGLVFMDGDRGDAPLQGQPVSDTGQRMRLDMPGAEYVSDSPFAVGLAMPQLSNYRTGRTPAGWVAASKKEKGDPETLADLRERSVRLLDSQVETAFAERDLKQTQLEQRRADLELTQQRNLAEQNQLRIEAEQKEKAKRIKLSQLDQEALDLTSRKTDPNRWYHNAGPGGVILAALARAAGTLGGTDDPGHLIDSFIQADIAQQEEEYRSASDRLDMKRNAFAREMADGADPELARTKIALLQTEFAKSMIEDREYRETLQSLGVDTDKLVNEFQEKSLNLRAQFESLFGQELDSKWKQASGGGTNLRAYLQDMKLYADANAAVGESTGQFPTESIRAQREKRAEDQGGLGASGFVPGTEKSEAEVTRVMQSVADKKGVTLSRLHLQAQRVQRTVEAMIEKHEGEIPGRGALTDWLPYFIRTGSEEDARTLQREVDILVKDMLFDESGAVFGPNEEGDKKRLIAAEQAGVGVEDAEVLSTIGTAVERVEGNYNAVMAGHRPEAVEEYERRFGEREQRNRVRFGESTFQPIK